MLSDQSEAQRQVASGVCLRFASSALLVAACRAAILSPTISSLRVNPVRITWYMYLNIYIYVCVCVCVFISLSVFIDICVSFAADADWESGDCLPLSGCGWGRHRPLRPPAPAPSQVALLANACAGLWRLPGWVPVGEKQKSFWHIYLFVRMWIYIYLYTNMYIDTHV